MGASFGAGTRLKEEGKGGAVQRRLAIDRDRDDHVVVHDVREIGQRAQVQDVVCPTSSCKRTWTSPSLKRRDMLRRRNVQTLSLKSRRTRCSKQEHPDHLWRRAFSLQALDLKERSARQHRPDDRRSCRDCFGEARVARHVRWKGRAHEPKAARPKT